jgi:hypothetical protein
MANLVTSEEILPLIQPALKDVIVDIEQNDSKNLVVRLTTPSRISLRPEVEKILSDNNITFGDITNKSLAGTFGGTQIDTFDLKRIRLRYKEPQGGGARGGTRIANLGEGSQCIYAAVAFGLGKNITQRDITKTNIEKYKSKFDIDSTVDEILDDLPEIWMNSSILGANKLFDNFFKVNGKFTFHKASKDAGSKIVRKINELFQKFKKEEGLSLNINKWNPADFWLVSSEFDVKILEDEKTMEGFNQQIQKQLLNNKLIGISLKQMAGRATLTINNVERNKKYEKNYNGYEFSNKSIDGYIKLSGNSKLQFRATQGPTNLTGWQGEIQGGLAAGGKISLGPFNMLLRAHKIKEIPTDAAKRVKNEPDKVYEEVSYGLEKFGKMKKAEITKFKTNKIVTNQYLYSKLQVVQLIKIFEVTLKQKKKLRDQLAEDMFLYAASLSKYSSAFYKLF